MDEKTHGQGRHQVQRGPEGGAKHHLEGALNAGNICSHARYQPCRRIFVYIREGKTLDVPVHGQPEVGRQPGAAVGGKASGQDAEHQAQEGQSQHDAAVLVNVRQGPCDNAFVDDGSGCIGDEHAHDHLQCSPKRRQKSRRFILLHLSENGPEHGGRPLPAKALLQTLPWSGACRGFLRAPRRVRPRGKWRRAGSRPSGGTVPVPWQGRTSLPIRSPGPGLPLPA